MISRQFQIWRLQQEHKIATLNANIAEQQQKQAQHQSETIIYVQKHEERSQLESRRIQNGVRTLELDEKMKEGQVLEILLKNGLLKAEQDMLQLENKAAEFEHNLKVRSLESGHDKPNPQQP